MGIWADIFGETVKRFSSSMRERLQSSFSSNDTDYEKAVSMMVNCFVKPIYKTVFQGFFFRGKSGLSVFCLPH